MGGAICGGVIPLQGKLNEVEPVGTAFVNLESVTDMFPWEHPLPKEPK